MVIVTLQSTQNGNTFLFGSIGKTFKDRKDKDVLRLLERTTSA
jgi:hypothetical protein